MNVRLLHTADLHIGRLFRNILNDQARSRVVQERIDALHRMVTMANERNCDFFVIAGDLFDKPAVTQATIKEVVEALKKCHGEVLVIPGNHDHYEGPQSKLWKYFMECIKHTSIHLLTTKKIERFTLPDGQEVCFYPCPCPSKHSEQHEIGWVNGEPKPTEQLHIGIAHGNVEGLALDTEGRYFNMTPQELKNAGLDCWLLGHVHVPYPEAGYSGNPGYFMPGTHTPDRSNRTTQGSCWFLTIAGDKKISAEQLVPGTLRFERLSQEVNNEADIELLETGLQQQDTANTLLELSLSGHLSEQEHDALNVMLKRAEARFLDLSVDDDIRKKIDGTQIKSEFADNTFSHQLLMTLLQGPDPERKVQEAYDLIKNMKA